MAIRVIVIKDRHSKPIIAYTDNDLQSLQAMVGGYIEAVNPGGNYCCLLVNEEGKMNGMKPNRVLYSADGRALDVLYGPIVIIGTSGSEFRGLTLRETDIWRGVTSRGDGDIPGTLHWWTE